MFNGFSIYFVITFKMMSNKFTNLELRRMVQILMLVKVTINQVPSITMTTLMKIKALEQSITFMSA